jgi:hypothetical protein
MAYLQKTRYEDEDQAMAPQSTAMPLGSSAPAPTASAAPSTPGAQPAQPGQQGRYPALMNFVNANRGQGQALAQRVGAKIGEDVGALKSADDQSRSSYVANAEQAWRDQEAPKYQEWQGQRQGAMNQVAQQQGAARRAGDDRGLERAADAALSLRDQQAGQTYQAGAAPTLNPYAPDESGIAKVQGDVAALGSNAGRAAYLRNMVGGGAGYTPGMGNLDAAILGQAMPSVAGQYQATLDALRAPPTIAAPTFASTAPALPINPNMPGGQPAPAGATNVQGSAYVGTPTVTPEDAARRRAGQNRR